MTHSSVTSDTSDVRKLYAILCGYEILPKSISVWGADPRFMLCEPVCAYLLDTIHGWVLLDAGLDPEYVNNTEKSFRYFLSHGMTPPIVRPVHRLDNQLAQIGLTADDISWIILSHLHFDHCGYVKYFPHARISIQKREYTAAMSSSCSGYIKEDFNNKNIQWDFKEGDWQAMPGLDLITTFGHTPGHQSAIIRLPKTGNLILAFDVGDLRENFVHELIPGSTTNQSEALHSLQCLNDLKNKLNANIILFHDPQEIQKIKLFPEHYE